MKATKTNELKSVYEAAIKVVTGDFSNDLNYEYLSSIFAPSFFLYGQSRDTGINNFQELLKEIDEQHKKSNLTPLQEEPTQVYRAYSRDKKTAVYVDEFQLKESRDPHSIMRISIVLFKTEEGWRVTHLHLSKPSFSARKKKSRLEDDEKKNECRSGTFAGGKDNCIE
jgi:hypothetical protein